MRLIFQLVMLLGWIHCRSEQPQRTDPYKRITPELIWQIPCFLFLLCFRTNTFHFSPFCKVASKDTIQQLKASLKTDYRLFGHTLEISLNRALLSRMPTRLTICRILSLPSLLFPATVYVVPWLKTKNYLVYDGMWKMVMLTKKAFGTEEIQKWVS